MNTIESTDTARPARSTWKKGNKPTEEQKAAAAAKRSALCTLTAPFRPYVEKNNEAACGLLGGTSREELRAWLSQCGVPEKFQFCMTLNACLQVVYAEQTGQTEWHTFHGWKEQGFSVEKGQKGFMIWSTPKKMQVSTGEAVESDASGETEGGDKKTVHRFAIAYLFHAGQVSTEEGTRPASYRPSGESAASTLETLHTLTLPAAREEVTEAPAQPLTIWDVEKPAQGQQLLICPPPAKRKKADEEPTNQFEFTLCAA